MENSSYKDGNENGSGNVYVRPAIFVGKEDIERYSVPLRHLMVGLGAQSCPAAFVCPTDAQARTVLCPSVELVYHPLFKIPIFKTQNRMEVLDKLTKFRPTILHCFSDDKAKITSFVSEELGIPYLVSVNSIKKLYHRQFVCNSGCAGIIGSSNVIVDKLRGHYLKCQNNIELVNMGAFAEDEVSCFSGEACITSMVVAQELGNIKELEALLNAVRLLGVGGYELMLAIVGRGSAAKKVREIIKLLGIGSMVAVVEEIKPIRSVFEGADVFIQLDVENVGGSNLLEAMSVGMCVATSEHNKNELIEDEKTAVLFDAHDEESIYEALKKLLCNHEYAREIAANGQQRVRSDHSVSTMVNRIIDMYRSVQVNRKRSKAGGFQVPS